MNQTINHIPLIKKFGFIKNGMYVNDYARRILDHCSAFKNDLGKKFLVGQPYAVGMDGFIFLMNFCKEHNLTFTVDGCSKHYPGHTFNIIISEVEE